MVVSSDKAGERVLLEISGGCALSSSASASLIRRAEDVGVGGSDSKGVTVMLNGILLFSQIGVLMGNDRTTGVIMLVFAK